ncbi:response regulator [Aquabacterium sp. CECT 9606]|jgi:response regulator RpfG family c-di-GMP phosphodiesterase|uniref:response regulator n=1 Tax=Aquabacterium sp. CECT 9606 TaxID=2845822 RepID=UPI001E3976C5|nr:response regulator [Aquabacterium sp. CECT 9606]CAH0348047.1 Hydrogenase transcriptional regulatory protein hupR1 [Aquabacterium sp. CECT 9606]
MSRILLLDDEPNVVFALQRLLRRSLPASTKVEGFDNPLQALARTAVVSFDVIVSDFRMPRMNGVEFLGKVRDKQPQAIRMILSATTEVETIMTAINDVEVFRYLTKPWREDELVSCVQLALERAHKNRLERKAVDEMRVRQNDLSAQEAERRRLEEQEPGITHVEWGPNGEVLMPDLDEDPDN